MFAVRRYWNRLVSGVVQPIMWKRIIAAILIGLLSILIVSKLNQSKSQVPVQTSTSSSQAQSFPPSSEIKNLFGAPVSNNGEDTCFCQLQGAIDDCACNIDTVDRFNNYKIFPRLRSLLEKDYFRYFQVNLQRECPFWNDDGQCALENCQVKECREDEVPPGLKGRTGLTSKSNTKPKQEKEIKSVKKGQEEDLIPCSEDLGYLNTSLSEQSQEGFERWKAYDESLTDFCSVRDDEVDPDLQYVDLLLNPERYTGYAGPSAHRIWNSIYNENCFKENSNLLAPFGTEISDEQCIEKRTFYRAISGLHSSINIHLSAKYFLSDVKGASFLQTQTNKLWGPNITEFRSHFDDELTNGRSPAWLKNLYFLYLLELKAIWKISPFLRNFDLYTGNTDEDTDMRQAIDDFLNVINSFPSHFEERALFSRKDAAKLKADFHNRFTNITRIMDCVGCQKCKLWGKLQIKGLGTALRILFTEPAKLTKIGTAFTRNEIVSLINGFGKLSESIFELDNLRSLSKSKTLGSGGTKRF